MRNSCDIADCIVAERQPAVEQKAVECTEPVLREFACKSAAEVPGRSALSADMKITDFDLCTEAR